MEEDTREGVYDTSKKQRVPSWVSLRHGGVQHPRTDQLVVRPSFVEGAHRAGPENTPSEPMHRADSRKPLDRLSAAITNWGGHFGRAWPGEHTRARSRLAAPLVLQGPTNLRAIQSLMRPLSLRPLSPHLQI